MDDPKYAEGEAKVKELFAKSTALITKKQEELTAGTTNSCGDSIC